MYVEKFKRSKKAYGDIVTFGFIAKIIDLAVSFLMAYFIADAVNLGKYKLAFSASMLFTKMIADAIGFALIPVYQKIDRDRGVEGRFEFTNLAYSGMFIFSIIILLLTFIFSSQIIGLVNKDLTAEDFNLVSRLFKLGLPIIIFHFIRGVCAGYLQSRHIFTSGSKAGVVNAMIFLIYILIYKENVTLSGLMIVGVIAVLGQFSIMFKAVRGTGYRYKANLNFSSYGKYIGDFIKYLLPIFLVGLISYVDGRISGNKIGEIVGSNLIDMSEANKFLSFVKATLVTGLVNIAYPILSEAYVNDDMESFKDDFKFVTIMPLIIILPLMVIIFTMSGQIASVMYNGQGLSGEELQLVERVIKIESLGLFSIMLYNLAYRIFYATSQFGAGILLAVVSIFVKLGLYNILGASLGHRGIFIANIITAYLLGLVVVIYTRKKFKIEKAEGLNINIGEILLPLIKMLVVLGLSMVIISNLVADDITGNLLVFIVSAFLSLVVYARGIYNSIYKKYIV